MPAREYDTVRLTREVEGRPAGTIGVVVSESPTSVLVELPDPTGERDLFDDLLLSVPRGALEVIERARRYRPQGPVYLREGARLRTFVRHQGPAVSVEEIFGPKRTDHPSHGLPCPACGEPFGAGDLTVLLPLGPAEDSERRSRARRGRWYSAAALEVHLGCASGEER